MKIIMLLLLLTGILCLTGCQADVVGPSVRMQMLYKGENGNNEWKSRNSGMASQTGYHMSIGDFGK